MSEVAYDSEPMLPRHRRRQYLVGSNDRKPTVLVRAVMVGVILIVVWYVASSLLGMLDHSIGRKTAAVLTVRSTDNVQVSLQGEEWQRAETNLKLYAGDAVATRGAGDATLQFFDGTKIRLDQASDLRIATSDHQQDGTSQISAEVRSGRVWVATAAAETFTGAIVRTISTSNYSAEVPGSAGALLSASLINVVRASGVGLKVTATFTKTEPVIFVGEGQYFSLTEDAKASISQGRDPYDFRDPVTAALLRDEFLISSYSQATTVADAGTGGSSSSIATNSDDPLTVTSPQNRAEVNARTVTVAGKVNVKVSQVLVNGQNVTIKSDRSFSVDLSMTKDPSMVISVEAQDAQGIPLSKIERTVTNTYKAVVEPVRFKSPVGSGETLTTAQREVEITGEAPPNTAGIMVNDYRLQLFKPGSKTWSYLASTALSNMNVGENTYSVVALDADGNKSPARSIKIVVTDAPAPPTSTGSVASSQPPIKQNPPISPGTLTVEKPTAGTQTDSTDSEFSIEGKTSSLTNSISVNGYTLSLYTPGSVNWKYIASTELGTMKRGRNVYRIVARNADGEILDVLEYVVNFQP